MKLNRVIPLFFVLVISLIALTPTTAQSVSTMLPLGGTIEHYVSTDMLSRRYEFQARQDKSLFLLIVSNDYSNAPAVVVSDAVTNENIATARMGVSAMCLRFGPSSEHYLMNVSADQPAGAQWYGIALANGEPDEIMCPAEFVNQFASSLALAGKPLTLGSGVTPGTGDCMASSATNGNVDVHLGNDLTTPIFNTVGVDTLAPVLGSIPDTGMVGLDMGDGYGFASGSLLAVSGNCTDVPVVSVVDSVINGTGGLIDLGDILKPDTNIGGLDPDALTSLVPDTLSDLNLLNVETDGSANGSNVGLDLGSGDENSLLDIGASG
ncbi:MAG: hypothetical protein U0521_30325, partial [Anaerolineae bacterium]